MEFENDNFEEMINLSENRLHGRIVNKHDIEANWLKATNFIPMLGEIIVYDPDDTHPHARFKSGDGKTVVSSLPFERISTDAVTENDDTPVTSGAVYAELAYIAQALSEI